MPYAKQAAILTLPSLKLVVDAIFTTGVLDSRFTFARSSVGTCINASLLLVDVAANSPRFDYSAITGQALGILIEPTRTNLALTSEGVDTDSGNGGTTILKNATGPNGVANAAWTVTDSAAASNQYSRIGSATVTAVPTTWYAIVKPGTTNKCQLSFGGGIGGGSAYANFLLSGAGSVLASGGVTNAAIAKFSLDFYIISFVCTPTAGTGNGVLVGFISADTDSRVPYQAGTGARTFIVYGGQIEQGSFPTSYIRTSGTAVTRAADSLKLKTWPAYATRGATTFVYEFDVAFPSFAQAGAAGSFYLFASSFNTHYANMFGASSVTFARGSNGLVNATLAQSPIPGLVKLAYTVSSLPGFVAAVNNNTPVNTTLDTSGLETELYLSSNSSSSGQTYGHARRLRVYNGRMIASKLQAMTV
jgi:hypothetical protein